MSAKRWLQSLLALGMLLGFALPAWAACPSPQTATVAAGGTAEFECSDLGFRLPASTPPQHGSLSEGTPTHVFALVYSNSGDGALSDTFVAQSHDDNTFVTFNITVQPASSITVSPASLPPPAVGVGYSQTLSASGGTAPYSYSLGGGALPAGLSLSALGVISGTPTASGSHTFTVNVTDSTSPTAQTASKSYNVDIPAPALDLSPDSPTAGVETVAYNVTLSGSGGTAPYAFLVESGALPPGVSLASSGAVTGTPPSGSAGSYTARIRMDDSTTISTGGDHFIAQDITFVIQAQPTITVNPASLPNATVAAAYSQTLGASGGTAPYSFAVTAGTLPAGLALNGSTGALSGTPTAGGTFNVTVTATDGNGFTGSRAYTLTVNVPTIAVSPASLPAATTGTAYSQTLSASGGTAAYGFAVTAGALPAGLSLAPLGTLSGTPSASGTFNFTVTATDSSTGSGPYTGSRAYTLQVLTPLTAVISHTNIICNGASNGSAGVYASGGSSPYTYSWSPSGGTGATATGLSAGTYTVTVTDNASQQITRSATITQPAAIVIAPPSLPNGTAGAAYSQLLTATGGTGTKTFSVVGALPAGLSLASDGTLSGTPTATGTANVTVNTVDANTCQASRNYSITIDAPPITLTPAALPDGAVGIAYSQTVAASGGVAPYTYSVATGALPAGLALAANGGLSGTPTASGSFMFTVAAEDANGQTGSHPYTLVIGGGTLALSPATLADGTVGFAYSETFNAAGGLAPYSYSVTTGSLPPGLTLNASTGALSGTPNTAGSYSFNVQATDSDGGTPGTVTVSYTLVVDAPTIVLTPATLPDGAVNSAYAQNFGASGGVAPYTYSVAGGALPAGLALSTDGALSGTPTTSGGFTFTVAAEDANGQTGSLGYAVTIDQAAPVAVDDTAHTLAGTAIAIAITDNDSGVIGTIAIAAGPGHGSVAIDGMTAVYTPTGGFFGSDSFTYTATGPGGISAAATVTVQVAALPVPVGQPQQLSTLAGQALSFDAAAGASGGPFTGVVVVAAPAEGELAIDGTRISYTPPLTAEGPLTIGYTLANAYGASAPISTTVTVNPVPIAAAHRARTMAGTTVIVELTENANGGPFTGADVLSVSPAEAGTASVARVGDGEDASYRLDFAAAADYAGTATLRYTLSNAHATSAPADVVIEVVPRSDPSRDPEVTGLLRAQAAAARRFARGQIDNFQQRLERLHGGRDGSAGFDNGLSVAIEQPCGERDWQIVGSVCPRPLGDEQAPVLGPDAMDATADAASPLFAIWTSGAMSFGDYDPQRGASGFEFETSGISVGADYHLGDDFALGAGLGYGRDVSDIGEHDSRSDADAWSTALYASYHPGDHFYLDGLLGHQWLSFQLRRHVTANDAQVRGERDGHQWFASLAAGYQWQRAQWGFAPYARVDAARATLDGYVEQGDPGQALSFAEQDIDTTTAGFGLRLDYRYERDWGAFAPQLRLEYQHDLDADSIAAMRYADLPLGPFYRAGIDGFDRNRLVVGLGAGWSTERNLGVRLEYRSLLGNSGADDQALMLQVEKQY